MDPVESLLVSKLDYIVMLSKVFVGEYPEVEVLTSRPINAQAIEIVFSFLPPENTKRPVVYDEFEHPRLACLAADELMMTRAFVELLHDDQLVRSFRTEKGLVRYTFSPKRIRQNAQ